MASQRRRPRWFAVIGLAGCGMIFAVLALELIVRWTWDRRQGVPGLVLGHSTRVEVLAPNYRGYFAGQPLRINQLGFRDDREYSLTKAPGVFRILVLGDSVTFGHGCAFKETWPYLLNERLRQWNHTVNWQVWNLGVPGYDTVLELRTLKELGPSYHPDLVIVGFYENDLTAWNYMPTKPVPIWVYRIKAFLKQHFYLYTKLRSVYNAVRFQRVSNMTQAEYEQRLLSAPSEEHRSASLPSTRRYQEGAAPSLPASGRRYEPSGEGVTHWLEAVEQFKAYHRQSTYQVVFFINIAPDLSPDGTRFVDGIHHEMNEFFVRTLGSLTPVVSSYEAFWHYRPDEVPDAGGHSLGEANEVKADVLFKFLTHYVEQVRQIGHAPTP